MDRKEIDKTKQLCYKSLVAAAEKLRQLGIWPRPPAARRLRPGYDFPYEDIIHIQEAKDFIEYLASNDTIKTIYSEDGSFLDHYILFESWIQLLRKVLSETEDKIREDYFEKWFNKYIKELSSESATYKIVETLTGLNLTEPRFDFDDQTSLTSTPAHRWISYMLDQYQYDLNLEWPGTGMDKASIVSTFKLPKKGMVLGDPHSKDTNFISRHLSVIDAIRLNVPGRQYIHCSLHFQESDFPLTDPLAYCTREITPVSHNLTTISRDDFNRIKDTWKERLERRGSYQERGIGKEHPRMATAIGSFLNSYVYQGWDNNILDLTIALEALFSPDDRTELRHRISLRSAWLINIDKPSSGSKRSHENKIYRQVKAMYDMRSNMVHGSRFRSQDEQRWLRILSGQTYDSHRHLELIELAVESARDIVRKAITACRKLSKQEGKVLTWPLPDNFDENILIAGQRTKWQIAAGIIKEQEHL